MMNRFQTSPAQVRDELARLMGAALHEGMKRLFAQAERQLFDLASSETDSDRRAEAFEAIALCRSEQDGFFRAFAGELQRPTAPWQTAEWHELIGDRIRALRFEDELAEAGQRCGIEHTQFEARVGQLHEDDPDHVPAGLFTLESISRAFLAQTRDLPETVRRRLIAHWGEQVLFRLTPIYSVLNDYLIQVGVLPGIKRLRDPLADAAPAITPATAQPAIPDVPQHAGPSPDGLAERLVPLVRATIGGDDQYLFRFERDQDWRTEDFAGFIMDRLEPTLPIANWPTRSREIIRLVGMTLSDVLNDGLIDPRHRRQIATLQLAVLLLAARDRHFLSDADHPMRRILNLLALIGSDPDLKPDIESTAAMLVPIQQAVLDNPAELDPLSERLRDISRGKPVEAPEPAVTPAHERLAQIEERCRIRVGKILAGHVNDMPLREPTRALLDDVFQPFMVRTMINQGRQSAPWAGIIGLLQDALTLQIDPTLGPDEVKAFGRNASQVFNDKTSDGLLADEQQALDAFLAYLDSQSREGLQFAESTATSRPDSASDAPGVATPSAAEEKAPAADVAGETAPTETETVASDSLTIPSPVELAPNDSDSPGQKTPSSRDASDESESAIDEPEADQPPSEPAIPTDGLLLASLPTVKDFFDQQSRSEEWFEVYTGPGRALRRLKIRDLDPDNGVVNFANRTGQAKLSLPVAQVLDDLFAERTRLVFGNPRFARSLATLRAQLEEPRDEH
ncbi:DUF1631 family protein [Guyparkeria halophila]|uniref:DUF1631 family protein n=1 Tax=Guyparkeria halophila TaxID=47960 RepID=A0A6I6CVY6_9GAMM|nr:DUF1631 family protein [Guyparkeria halophila]QGT78586.1 DUF1631 family protein [Guyparkeria halophila]